MTNCKKGKKMNFLDLGLSERTVKAINESGIVTPTTVQVDVIPAIWTMVIIDNKRYRVIDFITNYNTNTKICIVEEY